MKRIIQFTLGLAAIAVVPLAGQLVVPELAYDAQVEPLKLPGNLNFGEVARMPKAAVAADAAALREPVASRMSSTGPPTSRGTPRATSMSPTVLATTTGSRSSTRTGSSCARGARPER